MKKFLSIGDGNCNDELNTPECTNDAGDCLHPWEVIEPSDTIPEGCEIPNYIPVEYLGDAYCDPVLNTIEVSLSNFTISTLFLKIFLVPI